MQLPYMKRGGHLIYAGPLGPRSRKLVEYFEAIKRVQKIKGAGHNPATWMLETQRKSSKDTPTSESIWFAKDYDDEDSKFGEIILNKDEGGHDQEHETKCDYDKLSMEDQQVEENDVYNEGRKPKVKTHFWSTIISKVVQKIK
ncbi:pleiotropic drug resistance 4 [Artemisia annua]|uniref:Pleiotropic drug resistance 4 n=1 Tax=Artemisia annua TaxID=35608 RepID=A0A2U1MZ13_ARTAN|nr:pleiotropic drug resistance 4 [Artemisia annua]